MDRLNLFKAVILLASLTIVARLFYWQFISHYVTNGSFVSHQIELPSNRGSIYSSDNFPLVTNQEAFLVYAKPNEMKGDLNSIAQKLAPFFLPEKFATASAGLNDDLKREKNDQEKSKKDEIIAKISNKNLNWVQIGRKVTLSAKKQIENLNINGLGFESDSRRFYPEASMAAQLLGFVGSNKYGEDTGYFGLEGFYDANLKGQPGRLGSDIDPFGFPILVSKYHTINPKTGESLNLTIDRTIQYIVEKNLKQSVEKYGAKQGTVIISQPQTGQILAMATYPGYDPSTFSEFDQSLYKNPAVANTYEPGSTFKLVTMSAALDTKTVSPETKCDVCNGPRQIGGYEISTWNKKYYPDSTMTQIIEHSDNVGMTLVSEKLGVNKFFEYIDRFGFGKKTGIDLEEETSPELRKKEDWKVIDLATAAFGQGIAVTPIQMLQAVQAIANKGKLITPKIVANIVQGDKEKEVKPDTVRQAISPQTAAQITEMMVSAVEKGEARAFAPKGYRIAGKTGTAQIPVAGHYDPTKTIASFVGFAPADNPKFVILVVFSEPSASIFGSETAAPTFFAIANELFNYLAISPTEK